MTATEELCDDLICLCNAWKKLGASNKDLCLCVSSTLKLLLEECKLIGPDFDIKILYDIIFSDLTDIPDLKKGTLTLRGDMKPSFNKEQKMGYTCDVFGTMITQLREKKITTDILLSSLLTSILLLLKDDDYSKKDIESFFTNLFPVLRKNLGE